MKITYKKRTLILEYIYQRKLNAMDGRFVIVNQMKATTEASEAYEAMTENEKIQIYEKSLNFKIKEYLFDKLYNRSMFMYFVNGDPKKREMRIRDYVHYLVRNMGAQQKNHILEESGFGLFYE